MKTAESPIGIFDSGIGGLTVANAVLNTLPKESFIYFGDTAHLPYGDKSPETIQRYSLTIADFLIQNKVKLIIIACNSASAAAFDSIKEHAARFDIKVVNVIDPVVENISRSQYKKVGVIGTRATIGSQLFPNKIAVTNPETEVATLATPLLAPMIESGFVKGDISKAVVENYLSDPLLDDIEAIVLACTHYPLIKKEIAQFYQENNRKVDILATNEIVAQYVKNLLEEDQLISHSKEVEHQFFVSDFTESFAETTKLFYKKEVDLQFSPIFSGDL